MLHILPFLTCTFLGRLENDWTGPKDRHVWIQVIKELSPERWYTCIQKASQSNRFHMQKRLYRLLLNPQGALRPNLSHFCDFSFLVWWSLWLCYSLWHQFLQECLFSTYFSNVLSVTLTGLLYMTDTFYSLWGPLSQKWTCKKTCYKIILIYTVYYFLHESFKPLQLCSIISRYDSLRMISNAINTCCHLGLSTSHFVRMTYIFNLIHKFPPLVCVCCFSVWSTSSVVLTFLLLHFWEPAVVPSLITSLSLCIWLLFSPQSLGSYLPRFWKVTSAQFFF